MARGDLIDAGYGTMSGRTNCCSGFQWRYANTLEEAINTNSDIIEIYPYVTRTSTQYYPYSNDLRNSYVQITIGSSTTTQYLKTKYNFGNVTVGTIYHLTSEYNSSNPFGYGTPDSTTYVISRTIDSKTAYGARFTVPHNTDGSAPTVSVKWHMTNSSSHNDIEKTANLALDSIPRASKPTCANVTLGNAVTIYTNRVSTNFSHKLVIKIGSTTIQTITVAKANANYSWTPAISTYAPSIRTNPPTATATIECTTYNGDTQTDAYKVGTMQSTTCVLTVPQNSYTKPSASISIEEADATMITKNWGVYVQGKSKLAVTITGTPNSNAGSPSANITGYNSTLNISSSSTPYNTNTYTTGILSASGNIKATVSDARGFSSEEAQKNFAVQSYSTPAITSYSVARCTSNGTLSDTGTYIKYTFKASISSVSNKNSKSFTLKYKSTGSYTNIYTYSSGYSVNQVDVVYNANLSTSTVYTFRFEVTDSFTTTAQEVTILAEPDLMNFHKSGKSMAIGGISQRGDSEKILDNYLKFYSVSGGQFRGAQGGSWIADRDTALVWNNNTSQGGAYYPVISQKTKDGNWTIGQLSGENNLTFNYTTDTNYNNQNNTSSRWTINTSGKFSGSCAGADTATNIKDKAFATRSSVGDAGWASTGQQDVVCRSLIAFWNGAYSGTTSNLQYCDRGRFGTIVTKGTGDYTNSIHNVAATLQLSSRYTISTTAWTNQQIAFSGRSSITTSNSSLLAQNGNGIKCNFAGWITVTGVASTNYSGEFDLIIFKGSTQIIKVVNTLGKYETITATINVASGDTIYLYYNTQSTNAIIYEGTHFTVTRIS